MKTTDFFSRGMKAGIVVLPMALAVVASACSDDEGEDPGPQDPAGPGFKPSQYSPFDDADHRALRARPTTEQNRLMRAAGVNRDVMATKAGRYDGRAPTDGRERPEARGGVALSA